MKHLLPTNSIAVGVDDAGCIVLVARDGAPIATITDTGGLIDAIRTAVQLRDSEERNAYARAQRVARGLE